MATDAADECGGASANAYVGALLVSLRVRSDGRVDASCEDFVWQFCMWSDHRLRPGSGIPHRDRATPVDVRLRHLCFWRRVLQGETGANGAAQETTAQKSARMS